MIKMLAVVSSFRKHGNTAELVALVSDRLRELAAEQGERLELETLYLAQKEIAMCRGCRICFDQGEAECPFADEMLSTKAKMVAADGLIVASPVYVDDVNGVMKNWIDRLAYLCHRPQLAGKPVLLLATVGGGPAGHALSTLERALWGWGCEIVAKAGFKTGARMGRDEIASRFGRRIERLARGLFRSMAPNRQNSPTFVSLLFFFIKQRYWRARADQSVDYRFWRDQGWLEPGRVFYTPQEKKSVRVMMARAAGALLVPFVT